MDPQMERATLGEGPEESFEELIAGRYREAFQRKVQQLVDKRFAQHRTLEAQWRKWIPALEGLCAAQGLAPGDAEGLDAYFAQAAGSRERREALRAWAACRALRGWVEEAMELGRRYPAFDLAQAAGSADFLGLLRRGLTVRQAWELCHRDELLRTAMEAAARHVQESAARSQLSRQARPRESAMVGRGAAPRSPSMANSSRAQREALERRALRGEHIVL